MELTKEEKKKIEEEEKYRTELREQEEYRINTRNRLKTEEKKKKKGVGCLVILLIIASPFIISAFITFSSLKNPPKDIDKTTNNSVNLFSSSTPDLSLVKKIKNRQNPLNKDFIIQGQVIKTGDDWDSVYEKLGKPTSSIKETNPTYGLIVEHQYGDYKLLIVRNTSVLVATSKCSDCYIVYDIYTDKGRNN